MLTVKNLKKSFVSGDTIVTAVNDVSFSVKEGSFASIVGSSGSGKSTLLTLLGALDKPQDGSVEVDGQDVTRLSSRALNAYRCQKIGFVFQNYNLVPNLTAIENVVLPMEFAGAAREHRQERAVSLLKEVGLTEDQMRRKPGKLSGGQQQRVAIARALANHPKLILADEPTGNLDSATGAMIIELLRGLAKTEKTTILAVTHDDAIARKADVTYRLKDGKLVQKN